MKVLMLLNRLNVGGTETYLLSLTVQLRLMGIPVSVAARGGPWTGLFRRSGIPVHLIPYADEGRAAGFIRQLAARHGYDRIHAHDTLSFRWVSRIGAGRGTPPAILTLHGKYLKLPALKQAAAIARSVVAVSPGMAAWARQLGVPPAKLHMIPNGINTLFFKQEVGRQPWKSSLKVDKWNPLIVYAGRFQHPKHLLARKLIDAAPLIAQAYPRCGVVLAGPGPFLLPMRRRAAAINKALGREMIAVWPAMQDIRRLYWAGDLVVGTGRVAMEAMACGRPVLGAGVSGYSGPVTPASMDQSIRFNFGDHGGNGVVTPRKIASGAIAMLKDKRGLPRYIRFGRRTMVRRFGIDGVARQMLALYKK